MSKTARPDDIDNLVSSVRDFVSHKEPKRTRSRILADRLLLTPDQRVSDADINQTPVIVDVEDSATESNVHILDHAKDTNRAGLEATIADLEAAVTAQSDDWEPDEGESFESSAWAASAFQNIRNDSVIMAGLKAAKGRLDHDAVEEQQEVADMDDTAEQPMHEMSNDIVAPSIPQAQLAAEVTAAIDPDMLRELVAEIVRDELGGELGERITRNVRKLVRREINRVLTSREMGED